MKRMSCVIVAAAALVLAGCQQQKASEKALERIPVRVEKVSFRAIDETVAYVGDIRGNDEAKVYPKVSGKVSEKVKEEGALVAKGDVILYLDRDEVGMTYEKAPVESPLAGMVGAVYVDKGENVSPSGPVALVVNIDKVKVAFDLPEKYIARVSVGQKARVNVDAYPSEKFDGEVTLVSPVVNLQNRGVPVEILIDNPQHRLKPGMFARISLVLATHTNVPVVMQEAVLGKNSERYVYVVVNGKAALRKVVLGVREGALYEIKEGLQEGDMVVVVGQQRLYENADVNIERDNG